MKRIFELIYLLLPPHTRFTSHLQTQDHQNQSRTISSPPSFGALANCMSILRGYNSVPDSILVHWSDTGTILMSPLLKSLSFTMDTKMRLEMLFSCFIPWWVHTWTSNLCVVYWDAGAVQRQCTSYRIFDILQHMCIFQSKQNLHSEKGYIRFKHIYANLKRFRSLV